MKKSDYQWFIKKMQERKSCKKCNLANKMLEAFTRNFLFAIFV